MEKFAEILKVVAEKHLIPFVSSLVGAGMVYLLVPHDCWVIEKMQKVAPNGFVWFVAGCIFLLINLAKYITGRMSAWKKEKTRKQHSIRESLNGSTEARVVWDLIDELTDEQLSCVIRLVKRKNRPIKIRKDIESDNWWKYNDTDIIRKKGQDRHGLFTSYSLGESLYNILSTLNRVNGKITRPSKSRFL